MAGLRMALRSLRRADDVLRSRNGPAGAVRAITAYLAGFAAIRTAANAYIFLATLRPLVSRTDAYGLAVLMTIVACIPLAAVLVFSRSRLNIAWRLSSLPVRKFDRLVIASIEPLVAALPLAMLASLVPAVAALPIAPWSLPDYLKAALWYPLVTTASALGIRSLAGAFGARLHGRTSAAPHHGRTVALAAVLLMAALANPDPVINGRGLFLSLCGSRLAVSLAGTAGLDLPLAPGSGLLALGVAIAVLAFAAVSALVEDAALRHRGGRAALPWPHLGSPREYWPMAAVVDGKRTAFWSLLACLALALFSVAQSAAPVVPLALAAAMLLIRSISALAFIATESATTRRFALIPARAAAADRAYLITALALAALIVTPLMAAGVARMVLSGR